MIGRRPSKEVSEQEDRPKGFDDFELRLGDMMRGERATMAKSLLDVQRELKIRASYVAAIENCDPAAFDTPGFIAGYVRSYARYLGMDPEWAYSEFCRESGFETAHGMSTQASPMKQAREDRRSARGQGADMFMAPATPFTAARESAFSGIEPRALGSVAVLGLLIVGLGFGAWTVLQEIQRVQFAPVEQAPDVAFVDDPVGGVLLGPSLLDTNDTSFEAESGGAEASADALDRLYRPEALDVPVLVARDAPIASLDPDSIGAFGSSDEERRIAGGLTGQSPLGASPEQILRDVAQPQVVDGPLPEVVLFAVEPTWVRVQTPDQSIVFERVLETGEEYAIPVTEETPLLRAGNAGSLYFKVNGTIVGPAGPEQGIISNVELAATDLSAAYTPADPIQDAALFDLLRSLDAPDVLPAAAEPAPFDPTIHLVAAEDSWVRVRDASGAIVFEGIIGAGTSQALDANAPQPQMRAGNSGALYFRVGETFYGPAGGEGETVRNVDVSLEGVATAYPVVDPVPATLSRD